MEFEEMGMYRYNLKDMEASSAKFGVCRVCGKHVSEVYHQIEENRYSEGWTQHECRSLWGHKKKCLIKQRRTR